MAIFDYRLPNDKPYRLVWPLLLLVSFLMLAFSLTHTTFFDALNQATLYFFIQRHTHLADIFFISSTLLCEVPYNYAFAAALLTWLLFYRHWRLIIYFVVVIELVAKLSPFLKNIFDILRPSAALANLGYAFPSGHTFLACVVFGFLSLVLTQHLKRKQKVIAMLAYNLPAMVIGVSRLYLGVHWLTDVIGGALIAWVVNLFCFFVYITYATYTVKPNRALFILAGLAFVVVCYLVNVHIDQQLQLYKRINELLLIQHP